jgi:hypothetical protein
MAQDILEKHLEMNSTKHVIQVICGEDKKKRTIKVQ